MLTETRPDGNHAVPRPTRKAWTEAARAVTRKERIAPGIWNMESASHAGLMYRVDLWTHTCQCPAARLPSCWHRDDAAAMEREIAEDTTRRERLAPGQWAIGAYTVTVTLANGTSTCTCPDGAAGDACAHAIYCEAQERIIVQAEHAALQAAMRADLARLAAGYAAWEGIFHQVVQDYAEEVMAWA
jgi:hypothetical protein